MDQHCGDVKTETKLLGDDGREGRLRTYSHLEAAQRLPTDYELVTSKLHYYVGKGFEVAVPLQDWYRRYQEDSPFKCRNWEAFADPRETTYTSYVRQRRSREEFVDGVLRSIESSDYDQRLSVRWLDFLERFFCPLRYPCHGLQMTAAYIGHMAPGGRVTVAALLQVGDELRRVERLAYRLRQIQGTRESFGKDSKETWQADAAWQPLRRLLEQLLVTFDWAEAFVANNLVVKPLFDELFMQHLGALARTAGDYLLGEIFGSLYQDCLWHREWSVELVRTAVADRPSNLECVNDWLSKWHPLMVDALVPIVVACEPLGASADSIMSSLESSYESLVASLGKTASG